MAKLLDWMSAKRVVCFRLDTLGDVLMTMPAIRALKEAVADRQITLVSSGTGAAVAELIPQIDQVLPYQAPWLKATPERTDSRPDLEFIVELRRREFDAAVIFTVFSQSALPAAVTCFLADIPLRLAHCRENPYQLLTNWVPESEPQTGVRHEVQRQLDLVSNVGAYTRDPRMSIDVSPKASKDTRQILRGMRVDTGLPWVVIHPGATAASRRYPAKQFAAVAEGLVGLGFQVVFTGNASERDLVEVIRNDANVQTVSLADLLSLEQMAALIAMVPVLISNNSGPVHLAAAVGTPVVDLYALTNPQHTPWRVPHRVLSHDVPCKYCYKSVCPEHHNDCLRLIPPQSVIDATIELLAETRGQLAGQLV